MIHHVKGDLLASDCQVIGHQCNCLNTFGAGIALQIKRQFRRAYEIDRTTKRGDRAKMGDTAGVPCLRPDGSTLWVYNLYGQYECGGGGIGAVYTEYDALEAALRRMVELVLLDVHGPVRRWPKVGLPYKIGCALGGGDWPTVLDILERVFEGRDLYLYEYTP